MLLWLDEFVLRHFEPPRIFFVIPDPLVATVDFAWLFPLAKVFVFDIKLCLIFEQLLLCNLLREFFSIRDVPNFFRGPWDFSVMLPSRVLGHNLSLMSVEFASSFVFVKISRFNWWKY